MKNPKIRTQASLNNTLQCDFSLRTKIQQSVILRHLRLIFQLSWKRSAKILKESKLKINIKVNISALICSYLQDTQKKDVPWNMASSVAAWGRLMLTKLTYLFISVIAEFVKFISGW